jgi:hypothetical protein
MYQIIRKAGFTQSFREPEIPFFHTLLKCHNFSPNVNILQDTLSV